MTKLSNLVDKQCYSNRALLVEVGWICFAIVLLVALFAPQYIAGNFMASGADALVWQPTLLNYLRDAEFFERPIRNWLGFHELYHGLHFGIDYPLLYLGAPENTLYSAYLWDQGYVWIHRCIMLSGAYLLVRAIGVSQLASVGLGLVFTLLPHFQIWDHWIWTYTSYAWMPWFLMAPVLALMQKKIIAALISGVLGFVLMSFGGPLSISHAAILYGLVFLFSLMYSEKEIKWLPVIIVLLAPFLGLMVAAFRWFPAISRMDEYIRWAHIPPPILGGMKPTYEQTLGRSAEIPDLLGVFLPWDAKYLLGSAHVGVAIVFLAFIGMSLVTKKSIWLLLLMGAVAIYFAMDALGDATFIHRLTYDYLPVFNSIRYTSSNLIVVAVFFFLLAAIGVRKCTDAAHKQGTKMEFILAGALIIVVLVSVRVGAVLGGHEFSWILLTAGLVWVVIYAFVAIWKPRYCSVLIVLLPGLMFPSALYTRVSYQSSVLSCDVVSDLDKLFVNNISELERGSIDVRFTISTKNAGICKLLNKVGYQRSIANNYGLRTPLGAAWAPRLSNEFFGRYNTKIETVAAARLFGVTHVVTNKELAEFKLLDQAGSLRLYSTTVSKHLALACDSLRQVVAGQCLVIGEQEIKGSENGGQIDFLWPEGKKIIVVRRFAGKEWRVIGASNFRMGKYRTGDILLERHGDDPNREVKLRYLSESRKLGVYISLVGVVFMMVAIAFLRRKR